MSSLLKNILIREINKTPDQIQSNPQMVQPLNNDGGITNHSDRDYQSEAVLGIEPDVIPIGDQISTMQNSQAVQPSDYPSVMHKRSCLSYLFTGCVSFGLIIILLLVLMIFILVSQYRSYAEEITSGSDQSYLITEDSISEDERADLQTKLQNFQEEAETTTFIVFTPRELGVLIYDVIAQQIDEPTSLDAVSIKPSENLWEMSFKLSYENKSIPWFSVQLFKEDQESAELYIPTIIVAGVDLKSIGLGFIVDRVNDGYREALLVTDEGSVTSRLYENIELTEDSVIIKAKKIEPPGN